MRIEISLRIIVIILSPFLISCGSSGSDGAVGKINPSGGVSIFQTPTSGPQTTPSNEFVITEMAKTPPPFPWATSLPNKTGLTPGKTTVAEAKAMLGKPAKFGCLVKTGIYWTNSECDFPDLLKIVLLFRSPEKEDIEIVINRGVVSEIYVQQNMKVESVITTYGTPDLVKFTYLSQITEPPPPRPWGELIYAIKGIRFRFSCNKQTGEMCDGVPRTGNVLWQINFAPTSLQAWFEQELTDPPFDVDRTMPFYVRPWEGFKN